MKTHWYKLSAADALKELGSDAAPGLAATSASRLESWTARTLISLE